MKIFDWTDRGLRGFIAGIIAGTVKNITNLISYYVFHFATLRYIDYMSILIYGHKPHNFAEESFALVLDILFTGLLSTLVAYAFPLISSKNYLFKGWGVGLALYFGFYILTTLYKVQYLRIIPYRTAVSNIIGASLFGITLALMLKWLDRLAAVKESASAPLNGHKYYLSPAPAKKRKPTGFKIKKQKRK